MKAIQQHPCRNVWLSLKLLCALRKTEKPVKAKPQRNPPPRRHRHAAFLELP